MEKELIAALRGNWRFPSSAGPLTVEDLFALPLQSRTNRSANLDDVARGIFMELKDEGDAVSFVNVTSSSARKDKLEAQLTIVKGIIAIKVAEKQKADEAQARREKRQKLLDLIATKENEQLSAQGLDELRAELAKIDD